MLQQHKYFFADVKNLPKTLTQVNVADTPIILNKRPFIIIFMAIACFFMVMFMANMGKDMSKMTVSVVRMSDDVHIHDSGYDRHGKRNDHYGFKHG